ncbi:hypothetical protein ACFE04_023575 [Oxalis oulophora]
MAIATDVNDMSYYSFSESSVTSPRTIPPSFRLIMTSKLASGMFPVVDDEFVANHLDVLSHSVIASIRVRNGYEYPCHVYNYRYHYEVNIKIYLGTGWCSFCKSENIRSGDILEFFLHNGGNILVFNVHITPSQQ